MTTSRKPTPAEKAEIKTLGRRVRERKADAENGARIPKADSPPADGKAAPRLQTTCAASISPKPLRWLVPDMLPLGKLVLLAGDGGLGKSTITIDLVSCVSRGEPAFGLKYEAPDGDALLISCEDDREDTILPRLMAANANLHRVHFLDGIASPDGRPRPFSLADCAPLESHLERHPEIRLVVIDPASAFAGRAGTDGNNDAELRALLGPLTEMAAKYSVTILLVAHIGKRDCSRAVQKVLGSVGWVNAVRAAWIVADKPGEEGTRLLMAMKANLSPRHAALGYRLDPLTSTEQEIALAGVPLNADDVARLGAQLFRVRWLGEMDADADEIFGQPPRRSSSDSSDIAKAAEWLGLQLSVGPTRSEACVTDGNAELGIDKPLKWWRDSILKARLGGHSVKKGFPPETAWYFTLPGSE